MLVDIGAEKNIRPLSRLICYREGEVIKHPVTGRILGGDPEELGEFKIKSVYKDFSKAEVVRSRGELKVLDKVISR